VILFIAYIGYFIEVLMDFIVGRAEDLCDLFESFNWDSVFCNLGCAKAIKLLWPGPLAGFAAI